MDNNFTTTDSSLPQLESQAISAANIGQWEHAVRFNSLLLEQIPLDIPTLNRLGRAYTALGNLESAKQAYQKVLNVDPQNQIALKNLNKLTYLSSDQTLFNGQNHHEMNSGLLIKKPGSTRLVSLVHLGPCEVCASLSCGSTVELIFGKRDIHVQDNQNRHIGRLPDDLAYRMHQLINLGVTFKAIIKDAHPQKVHILIQELGS